MMWANAGETIAELKPMVIKIKRIIVSSPNWIVDRHKFGTVWECCFKFDLRDHFGNPLHDLITGQDLRAFGHKFGHRSAVARSLEDKIRYNCYTFGVVQLQTPCKPSLVDQGGERDHELVSFTRVKFIRLAPFNRQAQHTHIFGTRKGPGPSNSPNFSRKMRRASFKS